MNPFTQHTGLVALMDRSDVDTDQIIPKQFLKRVERTGFENFLFYDWRFDLEGHENPQFELNQPRYRDATILVARRNFGCGSSREHAVWALENFGFRTVIASSFADIFYNNCFKNGILPITFSEEVVEKLFQEMYATEGYELAIDLAAGTVTTPAGESFDFEIDEFRRWFGIIIVTACL